MIWVLVKRVMCGILARAIINVIKHVKLPNTKNCSWGKRLIGRLVFEWEDDIISTTKPLPNDKKSSMCKL